MRVLLILTRRSLLVVLLMAMSVILTAASKADDASIKELILPGEAFRVEGRPAFVFLPPQDKRITPQPWIMYCPTLPGLPDTHEKWMHEQFLAAGVAVAGIDVGEGYGSPKSQKLLTALYQELTSKRGYAKRVYLLGRSRGGLWMTSWAAANPEKVAGIAGIYPVFDLRSYPGLREAAKAYELTPENLESQLRLQNPINRVSELAKAKIPVCLIHGDQNATVPLKDNSAEFKARYITEGAGELVQLIVAEGQGHNYWEGFFRCPELIAFSIEQAKAGSK